jgi:peptide/nickel transport system permease protein
MNSLTYVDSGDQPTSDLVLDSVAARPAPRTLARIRTAFWKRKLALVSVCFLLLVVLLAIAAPVVAPQNPTLGDLSHFEQAPSWQHWLGTDSEGRDVWSRLIWGSRASLLVGIGAVVLSTLIGIIIGAVSGYYRGFVDGVLMRITDAFLSFPTIVLLLMLAAVLGPSLLNVVLVIGFLNWTGIARLVRGEFFSLREQVWVTAARAIGAKDTRIIRRHLLPHVVSPVAVAATFGVGNAILTEAALSYLGLGVPPPNPSWGAMLAEAQNVYTLQSLPWVWLSPGITVVLVVLAVNYVGDTLRSALDPYAAH